MSKYIVKFIYIDKLNDLYFEMDVLNWWMHAIRVRIRVRVLVAR
jgi:hypothetical protein